MPPLSPKTDSLGHKHGRSHDIFLTIMHSCDAKGRIRSCWKPQIRERGRDTIHFYWRRHLLIPYSSKRKWVGWKDWKTVKCMNTTMLYSCDISTLYYCCFWQFLVQWDPIFWCLSDHAKMTGHVTLAYTLLKNKSTVFLLSLTLYLYLEEVSSTPLTAPKVEHATKNGIIQAM